MIYGAILAGGVGSRMQNENLPKQFMKLGTKPIIMHTLEKFLLCPQFDAIYIGVHPDWLSYMDGMLETHIGKQASQKVFLAPGGPSRNDTLFNAIDAIESKYGSDAESIIVTHDAVRPFVSLRIIEENIKAALLTGACDTVVAATDTIIESRDGISISDIPLRSYMYQAQTPQSFNIQKLKGLYSKTTKEQKEQLTDACKIFTLFGEQVLLVAGDALNFKITTLSDYNIAKSLLSGMQLD
ncbi:MAG: 2-C-methyl-D-erythritol 4-phosphate cytidylyltransferase [Eubacteriaceae bacterium]|nr:2-C-methyl-D-erythritol 4-phosphate cytidylyltransferase [Eubacteriaceae bacterium]